MLRQIISYVRFLARSTNDHGIHSPFVYSLVTKCLYDRKYYPEYAVLKQHRHGLLNDETEINVTDFGAGSRVFRSDRRKVNDIARHAGISQFRSKMLFRIVAYFKPTVIVEVGTSVGLATVPLALGTVGASVHSAEGCPETIAVANDHLISSGISNTTLHNQEFGAFFEYLSTHGISPDLVYLDGNHTKAATIAYFELLLPLINEQSVIIFDDIHWSREMEEAWEVIKDNPKVTVTIDTFQWGLVFFRSGQEKEHFTVRC